MLSHFHCFSGASSGCILKYAHVYRTNSFSSDANAATNDEKATISSMTKIRNDHPSVSVRGGRSASAASPKVPLTKASSVLSSMGPHHVYASMCPSKRQLSAESDIQLSGSAKLSHDEQLDRSGARGHTQHVVPTPGLPRPHAQHDSSG